jgi:hypothetical protein
MVRHFTQEEWKTIADIVASTRKLQEALNEKGFEVVNSFSTGIYPACITFIVKRNHTEVLSVCILDILEQQERVQAEIFRKGEEILNTDYNAIEIKMLKERLAQLEEHKGGCC